MIRIRRPIPVSYTHLDVYKRQMVHNQLARCPTRFAFFRFEPVRQTGSAHVCNRVRFDVAASVERRCPAFETCLDVYKRQRTVRNWCAVGKIKGAFLTGKTWNIPEDAVRPRRGKEKDVYKRQDKGCDIL